MSGYTDKSKTDLVALENFSEPREVEELSVLPNKNELGKVFNKNMKMVEEALRLLMYRMI